jgi:glycogen phosphorylase
VIPEFYARNENGIPVRWIERIRKSMATLTPRFSANRAVREYTEQYYLPAAANYIKRAAEKGAAGIRIVDKGHDLRHKWGNIRFGDLRTEVVTNGYQFDIGIWLNDINRDMVGVELYAEGIDGGAPERIRMEPGATVDRGSASENGGEHTYHGQVMTTRPASDYTVRIIPGYEGIAVPLEDNLILWQR